MNIITCVYNGVAVCTLDPMTGYRSLADKQIFPGSLRNLFDMDKLLPEASQMPLTMGQPEPRAITHSSGIVCTRRPIHISVQLSGTNVCMCVGYRDKKLDELEKIVSPLEMGFEMCLQEVCTISMCR